MSSKSLQNGTKGWFNKGILMNLGFQHAISSTNATCVVFHDVDVVPVDDRNSYMCGAVPRLLAENINNGTYVFNNILINIKIMVGYRGVQLPSFNLHSFKTHCETM